MHLGKCRDRQQKVARRGRGFLQVVHIFERRMVLAEMRPNSTSHRAASDGLRGLHLKRRLELILARRVLTRPYLRRGAAPKRPAIGILLGAQLGDDRPILRGERCRNSHSPSPCPTCHAPPLPTLKTLQQCGAQPLPHTPRQGPPSPAGNSTTHALTTVSLFRASSRTQTDAEVVPHRTPKAGIFNPPAYIDTRLSTVSNLATLVPADPADGPHRVL